VSDVQDEVFQEAVPSPSAANEALDSSIPCEGGGQAPSVPPVSEGDTVTNAEIAELLASLGLAGLEKRFPDELSGGQQRRVALARALLVRPRLLLLDEPFTGLDAGLRRDLVDLVREAQRARRLTTVFVTHEEEDAARIADSTARFYDAGGIQSLRQERTQSF